MPKNKMFYCIHGFISWMQFNTFRGCKKMFYGCGKMLNEVILSNVLYLGKVDFMYDFPKEN